MIRLPVIATVGLAKLAATATKATGRGDGSALPGLVAERLDPNIAAKMARFRQGTILVTGTTVKPPLPSCWLACSPMLATAWW